MLGTSAGAAEDAALAPIVPEQRAYSVGAWAAEIYPELDVLVSSHLDELTYVTTTPEGTIQVGAPSTKLATQLVSQTMNTMKVSATTLNKVSFVATKHSAQELYDLASALMDTPEYDKNGAGLAYIDPARDGIVLDMLQASDEFRKDLYAKYGETVAVQLVSSRGGLESGPQRDKDRYKYWGASTAFLFATGASQGSKCTAGVPMVRSNGDHIMVTAGHCTSDAASVNVYSRAGDGSISNLVGNTYGLTSTFRVNVPNRGDIGAWNNNGSEGRIWTGGVTGTTSEAIKARVLGTPDPETELCMSGAVSGVQCTFRVTGEAGSRRRTSLAASPGTSTP